MNPSATVVTSFKDLPNDEDVRDAIDRRCEQLAREFHEISRVEIKLAEDGSGVTVHAHVTGKSRDLVAHAEASEAGPAADRVLDKVERQLRTLHDKRIFSQRREAQRDPPKKRSSL